MAERRRSEPLEKEEMMMEPVLTPDEVAARWRCTSNTVRARCKDGSLRSFRVGAHFRIPASAVKEYEECQISQSAASEEASASSGTTPTEGAGVISLRHATGKRRREKPSTCTAAQLYGRET